VYPYRRAEPPPPHARGVVGPKKGHWGAGPGRGPSEVLAGDGAWDAGGLVRPLLVRGAAAMLQTIQMKQVVLDTAVEAGVTSTTQPALLERSARLAAACRGFGPIVLRQRLRGAVKLRAGQPESAFELRDRRLGGWRGAAGAAGAGVGRVGGSKLASEDPAVTAARAPPPWHPWPLSWSKNTSARATRNWKSPVGLQPACAVRGSEPVRADTDARRSATPGAMRARK
jgi:hypothetical protein